MRKHRTGLAAPIAARRPDGLPNRAMFRAMSVPEQLIDADRVQRLWFSIAAALIPGAVTK